MQRADIKDPEITTIINLVGQPLLGNAIPLRQEEKLKLKL